MADSPEARIPFRNRLTVRLTAAVIVVLLLIGSPFLLAFHTLRRSQERETLTKAMDGISRLVVDNLRTAMLAGEPHLIDEAIGHLAEADQVDRVLLLEHRSPMGRPVGQEPGGQVAEQDADPACAVCHQPSGIPAESRTMVTESAGHRILRSMTVIRNEPRCHTCHDPATAVNGVLMLDLALRSAEKQFFADIGRTVVLGALMVLVTIAVLVWLLRDMVHKPLQAVVQTSRRIVDGDLDAQADVPGTGEFAALASQVNRMTAHLSRSLRTLDTERRELQTILDAIDDEVLVLDSEQRVVMANEAFRRSRSPVRAPTDTEEKNGSPVERVFATGRLQKGIVSATLPDGQERVTEIHASPLCRGDGAVDRVVAVRRDISERRQMEAVVAQSERLASLGLLASGLSHEINNPLGAIATTVEGLRRRLTDQPGVSREAAAELERVLSRISREVERGRTITHRLLRVARPPTATRSLSDLNHVVENILAILAHDIRRSRITTRLRLGELPPLPADEARLGQVVMNLAINAIQAMSDGGGELRITTSATNGEITLRIEDTGAGIPGPLLKRVFEPFFTTKPAGQGTGLGLFITHRIVSDLGGTIGLHSEPEQGASFTVRLPRSAIAAEQ